MKAINAIDMRHLTNEVVATKDLPDYQKEESPMASEIKYLQVAKAMMDDALDGKHETTFHYNEDDAYSSVLNVVNQLKAQGYKVDAPNYSNYIVIKW